MRFLAGLLSDGWACLWYDVRHAGTFGQFVCLWVVAGAVDFRVGLRGQFFVETIEDPSSAYSAR
ncbi:MAG: hypothetical protein ACYSUT_10875, partial [Planctomycetota bacterium]